MQKTRKIYDVPYSFLKRKSSLFVVMMAMGIGSLKKELYKFMGN